MAEGGWWRAGRGEQARRSGKRESYQISKLLSPSIWGEHGHTCA